MMMTLGWFVFMRSTFAPQSRQDERGWRHPGNSRVGARPAYQFLGADDETTTLSGTLYPELTGGAVSLDMLHQMADTGQAYPLIQGDGVMRGYFVIEKTSVTSSEFFQDGAARKIEFTMALKRVDDDITGLKDKLINRGVGTIASRLGVTGAMGHIGNSIGGLL
ncbi:phage tail protein [Plesiomonas shigelloides]|uniref:phage tail protein n=1 Tax=Plesiomonas shigelloides TaxID=703 RepID=UPI00057B420A|nr:phage tail protein [Plesiomonas shigelloides]KAB7672822.1 phage tail protein [Plesiomonas shigelloides]